MKLLIKIKIELENSKTISRNLQLTQYQSNEIYSNKDLILRAFDCYLKDIKATREQIKSKLCSEIGWRNIWRNIEDEINSIEKILTYFT